MAPVRIVTTMVEEIDSDDFRKTREASGLSGRELGRRVGVHSQFVSRLERGIIQEVPLDFYEKCIDAMIGEGSFAGHPRDLIVRSMKGEVEFESRPRLRLAGNGGKADTSGLDSASPDSPLGRSFSASADSGPIKVAA